MKYLSCGMISRMALNINGRIDTDPKVISLCCESVPSRPGIPLSDNAEETLERFIGLRTMLLAQGFRTPEKTDFGCSGCANYCVGEWEINPFIGYVNLSMYPAPCQCKCIYCNVAKKKEDTEEVRLAYERLFTFLELADRSGAIDPDAVWQISTGEITIHPYKDRILKLLKGKTANYYTNAFIFDEDIAQNMHDNPNSFINLSIDAGTPETWKKVKGFDNFDKVTDNLVKYYVNSARPGQITLKYIVLPGINDNYEDYESVIEIMKVLETKHLTISRDTRIKYDKNDADHNQLMVSAAYLFAMCHKNNITNDMFTYSQAERNKIIDIANELIRNKQI